jgi:P-type Na+/K+ transporter
MPHRDPSFSCFEDSRLTWWQLIGGGGVKWPKILLKQIVNAMMLVLLLAFGLSLGIGSYIEGGVVGAVVVLNIIVGFIQEYSAEKTMESLRGLSSPSANVIRQGHAKSIPSSELVPGDVVEVSNSFGPQIPVTLVCDGANSS